MRTDSRGNPIAVQVPPAIDSPRARRKRRSRQAARNTADVRLKSNTTLLTDGKWMRVVEIENLWKVNDEWWRGPDEEIARLYYVLRLGSGQQLTVYLDLTTNDWYRQAG